MTRGRHRSPLLFALSAWLGFAFGAGAPARAQVLEATALPPVRPPIWEVGAGVRTMFIKGAGYDPFSTNDTFVTFSLSGTRELLRTGQLALAAGLGLDIGGTIADARGAPSALTLTRISALAEGRYQPAPRFYFFGRVAPGLLHGHATIDDGSSLAGGQLGTTFDTISLDASGGAALCLGALGLARVGAWVTADGGYGWAPSRELVLSPSFGGSQNGTLDLGALAARGGFFRISVALGF